MKRTIFTEEHQMFRDAFRRFVQKEIVPYHDQWEKDGMVSREVWQIAGENGFLALQVPEEFGGLGVDDFRYNVIMNEEIVRVGASGVGFPYIMTLPCPICCIMELNRRKNVGFRR